MITEEICHLSNGKSVFSSEHNVYMNFFTKTLFEILPHHHCNILKPENIDSTLEDLKRMSE